MGQHRRIGCRRHKRANLSLPLQRAAFAATLAGEIGERHVFYPEKLQQAEDYIALTWSKQGYEVRRNEYEAV